MRPAIQADKGDIRLVDVDEETGVIKVELQGACVSCPASTQTLKAGIERIMKDRVPGVKEVINVGEVLLGEAEGTSVFVLPNPSGRNANFSYAEMLAAFSELARFAKRARGRL